MASALARQGSFENLTLSLMPKGWLQDQGISNAIAPGPDHVQKRMRMDPLIESDNLEQIGPGHTSPDRTRYTVDTDYLNGKQQLYYQAPDLTLQCGSDSMK